MASDVELGVNLSVTVHADAVAALRGELEQILRELGIGQSVKIEQL
jgi:hypothetical protein